MDQGTQLLTRMLDLAQSFVNEVTLKSPSTPCRNVMCAFVCAIVCMFSVIDCDCDRGDG